MKIKIILSFILFTSCLNVKAAEIGGSNYLPGFYGDFGMALVPSAGNYLSNFLGYNTVSDAQSNSNLTFELPGIAHVTEQQLAGGTYWLAFYPYVLRTESKTPDNHTTRGGAGDMYAEPIALTWQWQDVSVTAFEGIILPTGTYQKDRVLNSGRNYWTFDQNLALTWQPDNGRYDFSLDLGYMVNTQNNATHYRTGDELHLDYLAGYYVTKEFGIGIAGSYYRQLTKDSGNGVPNDAIRGEASTIGPVIVYNTKVFGHDATFSTKWLHEYNVNNHIAGDYIIVRTIFSFN